MMSSTDLLLAYSAASQQRYQKETDDSGNSRARLMVVLKGVGVNGGIAAVAGSAAKHLSFLCKVGGPYGLGLFNTTTPARFYSDNNGSGTGKGGNPNDQIDGLKNRKEIEGDPANVRDGNLRKEESSDSTVIGKPGSSKSPPKTLLLKHEFENLKAKYTPTKYPIILCHGLFGFDTLKSPVPIIVKDLSYWHGIKEALVDAGAKVLSASVPPVGPIETRAEYLAQVIERWVKEENLDNGNGESDEPLKLNLIGHSMGGLDARYMISVLKPPNIKVLSLTTIVTPHQGTSFADHIFKENPLYITKLLKAIACVGGVEEPSGIKQLTTEHMQNAFNPHVPDDKDVYYSSYGARIGSRWTTVLKYSADYIKSVEGDNDGLVSVESAKWGEYLGTIENCDHLDVVNLVGVTHWLKWATFQKSSFNAIALYLHIMDSLAKKGF
ncbi:Tgl2p [Sugiyamaella lignohabitans]|uniref:Tgl2p n=1 Tax=Sugiyamaella lignohabitans TaxID=796027 RepID=A0A167C2D9_9ASCO|nr:Tgl2p [Sugiyamaella lignohabitans]ANB11135.1 Tgl2p [Sugiyamaella lignohabitans]